MPKASSLFAKPFNIQLQLSYGLQGSVPTLASRLECAKPSSPFPPHTLEPLFCEFF